MFDRASMMANLMNDEELVLRVVEGFLCDIPKQIQMLRVSLEAGDNAATERQAHSIKGASANVGGRALRELAFDMEKAARVGNREVVAALLPELEEQFGKLKEAMLMFIKPKD